LARRRFWARKGTPSLSIAACRFSTRALKSVFWMPWSFVSRFHVAAGVVARAPQHIADLLLQGPAQAHHVCGLEEVRNARVLDAAIDQVVDDPVDAGLAVEGLEHLLVRKGCGVGVGRGLHIGVHGLLERPAAISPGLQSISIRPDVSRDRTNGEGFTGRSTAWG